MLWIVPSLVAVLLVLMTTTVHFTMFKVLLFQARRLSHFTATHIAIAIVVAIMAHLIEIMMFAIGIAFLSESARYGYIDGGDGRWASLTASDYFYYSAVTFTTVGFGDITPVGQLRFVTAIEALTGLVLSAWTASLIFLGVQKVGQQFLQETQD